MLPTLLLLATKTAVIGAAQVATDVFRLRDLFAAELKLRPHVESLAQMMQGKH